jgi:uncharacterized protein YciI
LLPIVAATVMVSMSKQMHYLLFYDVVDGYGEKRLTHRAAHLAHATAAVARGELVLGGALSNPLDQAVLLFRGDSPRVAEGFAETDPPTSEWPRPRRVRGWTTVVGPGAECGCRGRKREATIQNGGGSGRIGSLAQAPPSGTRLALRGFRFSAPAAERRSSARPAEGTDGRRPDPAEGAAARQCSGRSAEPAAHSSFADARSSWPRSNPGLLYRQNFATRAAQAIVSVLPKPGRNEASQWSAGPSAKAVDPRGQRSVSDPQSLES